MTTVVIGRNGKVYDLGKGEFPGDRYLVEGGKRRRKLAVTMVENAFTCTQEQADALKAGTLHWRSIRTSAAWLGTEAETA